LNSIDKNSIFTGSQDIIEFLINDLVTLLYLPEDKIVTQGQNATNLYFIAKGECQVWVKDQDKNNQLVTSLYQGDYFGEVGLLNHSLRTATVKSANYCTMASMNKNIFYDLCSTFPDIYAKMADRCKSYDDPWKQFKV